MLSLFHGCELIYSCADQERTRTRMIFPGNVECLVCNRLNCLRNKSVKQKFPYVAIINKKWISIVISNVFKNYAVVFIDLLGGYSLNNLILFE